MRLRQRFTFLVILSWLMNRRRIYCHRHAAHETASQTTVRDGAASTFGRLLARICLVVLVVEVVHALHVASRNKDDRRNAEAEVRKGAEAHGLNKAKPE